MKLAKTVASAAVIAYFVIGALVWWQTSTGAISASHQEDFASQAAWTQVENPHPYLDCWVLAQPELGGDSPQLLWCSKAPKVEKDKSKNNEKREKRDKSND